MKREEDVGEDEDPREVGLPGRRLALIRDVSDRFVFRFEFGPAVLAQVRERLEALDVVALAAVRPVNAPHAGFYQLFQGDRSVYVGRTRRTVGIRLGEHARKLRGRVPLDDMFCRYVFVEDLSLVALSEDALIDYFQPLGLDEWGSMGFGSKVTGYNRGLQESEWHERHPADLEFPVTAGRRTPMTLRQLISQVNRGAPMTLSMAKKGRGDFDQAHPEKLAIPQATRPFREWLEFVREHLRGWELQDRPMAIYLAPLQRP